MAASRPRRHRLLLYTHLLNRWWHACLAITIALGILAGGIYGVPRLLPQYTFLPVEPWKLQLLIGAAGASLLITILLAALGRSAFIQVFPNHLLLVTPFLRLNISLRRLVRTYTAQMQQLFPPAKNRGLRREILQPLGAKTVLVIEMTSFPIRRGILRLFLAPFFFPDRTASLALHVPDWMKLSNEVDSVLGKYQEALRQKPKPAPASGILASLNKPQK